MTNIFFLECSPHGLASLGARQAQAALSDLAAQNPDIHVVTRSLAAEPLAPLSSHYCHAVASSAACDDASFALSERLIRELESSDRLLINTPMHNFAVPAALKLWIDLVLRRGRSFAVTQGGKTGLLKDRPTLVLVRSGSACAGGAARQPDFLTPYLRHALSVLGLRDVRFEYLPGRSPTADALTHSRRALNAFFTPPFLNETLT